MESEFLAVFVEAADQGSLSAAARRLGIQPMAASRRIAALERDLGVRLLHRTPRSLSLTPEGETFLPFARAMLESEAAARHVMHGKGPTPAGLLRVTTTVAFGRKRVAPLVPGLLAQYPELRIDLFLTDRIVDIVAEGIDLALRLGSLRESNLIARRLAPSPRVLVASPIYLADRSAPRTIEELAGHECLSYRTPDPWIFETEAGARQISVSGRFVVNSLDAAEAACLGGAGIAVFARWNVEDSLSDGRLVEIELTDGHISGWDIWAVYPTRHYVLPKVRVLVAAIEATLTKN
jgi:DNA-binding transcriptional LysR family regulator